MKFSDMMGKGSDKAAVADGEATEAAATPTQWTPAPAPEAPIRFGSQPAGSSGNATAEVGAIEAPVLERTLAQPSIMDVMNELAPRPGAPMAAASAASDAELDTTAWLEGLGSIDDDLLPR